MVQRPCSKLQGLVPGDLFACCLTHLAITAHNMCIYAETCGNVNYWVYYCNRHWPDTDISVILRLGLSLYSHPKESSSQKTSYNHRSLPGIRTPDLSHWKPARCHCATDQLIGVWCLLHKACNMFLNYVTKLLFCCFHFNQTCLLLRFCCNNYVLGCKIMLLRPGHYKLFFQQGIFLLFFFLMGGGGTTIGKDGKN